VKVFLDANILFSAAKEESRIAKLIKILVAHGACVTNSYALAEAERNIQLKKYGALGTLHKVVTSISVDNKLTPTVPVPLKEKDVPILAGAIGLSCTHLLTGDRADFGLYFGEKILGIYIVSPQMMAEIVVEKGFLQQTEK
jgi:hypothetical protein